MIRGNTAKAGPPPAPMRTKPGIEKPVWLTPAAAKVWDRDIPGLVDAGVLSTIDATAMGVYCETFARWRTAMDHLDIEGELVKNKWGALQRSPWVSIADTAQIQLVKLLVEFGATAGSRGRVTKVIPEQVDNPFLKLLQKRVG